MDTIDQFYQNDIDLDSNQDKKDFRTKTKIFLKEIVKKIYKIKKLHGDEINYDNVVEKLALIEIELKSEENKIYFLQSVFPDQSIIDASNDIAKFVKDTEMRRDLYLTLKKIRAKKVLLPDECDQYLNKVILNKKIKGLDLPKEQRNDIKQLEGEIAKLCNDSNENVTKDNINIKFDLAELDGLTEEFVSNLNMLNNQYIVDRNNQKIMHILECCRVFSTRKKIHKYQITRGGIINDSIFKKILIFRHQYANYLGYQNYVDCVNKNLMLRNGNNIFNFLSNLASNIEESSRKEKERLLRLKKQECQEMGIIFDETIHPYDFAYYQRVIEEHDNSLDENIIKQYFPIDHVTKNILEIYEKLLHLRFYKIDGTKTWHESVTVYSVLDERSTKILGYFYLDLFQRKGKSSRIFHPPFKSSCITDAGEQLPSVVMVANFTKPENDKPSLLTHEDIETFFGRFCFVIHNIICKTRYYIFNATSVGIDFTHALMYMFEKFAWEKDVIRKLSSHYLTKKKMSDELITKLIISGKTNVSMKFSFRIAVSMYDYKLHTFPEADSFDLYEDCMRKYTPCPLSSTQENTNYYSFIKMGNNFNAMSYIYLLSEVVACDMFVSRFKKEGILNRETGMSFRKNILEPGSTKNAEELLKNFLGRNQTIEPFLEFYGLK